MNGPYADQYDTISWYKVNRLHRLDGPAVEYANGSKAWWVNDKLHRTDGPAVEHVGGTKEWWVNGKLHRLNGPAIECANGTKWWYVNNDRLGSNDEGFWKLWDRLNNQQRSNLDLLLHLPSVVRP